MKKIIANLSIILIALSMVGCAGLGDYEIELINGYRVIKSSPETITIYPAEDSLDGVVIPDYDITDDEYEFIVQVGHDEKRYIVAKANSNLYYIIDTKKDVSYGPLDKDEFIEKKNDLNISSSVKLQSLEDYTRDYEWKVEEAE